MMQKKFPIIILECANAHDGNYTILKKTILKFKNLSYPKLHIKFQPFSAETIATPSYEWFKIYKLLKFTKKQWSDAIELSWKFYDGIWLDIFDEFSIKILEENLKKVFGIKIQASTLENKKIIFLLSKLDLKNIEIILNISGKSYKEILLIIEEFEKIIPKKIIIQCGFQNYPSSLSDTNFKKVAFLKNKFKQYDFSYADHLDSSDINSILLPIKSIINNCEIIEKHISYKGKKSKYDNFSSLNYNQTNQMIGGLKFFLQKDTKKFITQNEVNYLKKTIQFPLVTKKVEKNDFLDFRKISYMRSNILSKKIYNLNIEDKFIAKQKINKFGIINKINLKKLNIGILIACRLKSKRLKKKALIKLTENDTLIDRCILSAKKIPCIDKVILATSVAKEDQILRKYARKHQIFFYAGSKDNVAERFLKAAEKYKIDVILRITGDCPEISSEISQIVLDSHIEKSAEYSVAKKSPIGFGVEVINTQALRTILKFKKNAELSEYLTYYFTNNPKIFNLNYVNLPTWMNKKCRMTIDYKEDVKFFKKLYNAFDKEKIIFNFKNLNFIIKKYKKISKINSHLKLTYKTNKELISKIKFHTKLY
jgi:spore coat polysaccharide biosynthesis protein SpsF (cytidylyltransferase family)/sialic acid synthase SpsE